MAYGDELDRKSRIASAALSAGAIALVALTVSLNPGLAAPLVEVDKMTAINLDPPVPPPPPPAPIPEPKRATPDAEGAAAPPNKRAAPSPVVRPKPKVELKQKTDTRSSPDPGKGSDNNAGAAPIDGPGSGAGGQGDGRGSGRFGSGTGGGGIGRDVRKIAGDINNKKDYPKAVRKPWTTGKVVMIYTVGTDGRVTNCRVKSGSGNAARDTETCRLVERRFRYQPALDKSGQPMAVQVQWTQNFWYDRTEDLDPD